ncbi:MAG: DUF99 family protein [Methanolinea sp.]|jgi:endonuclease V-like protein UPF0215 family|nr:DUF99 family protein [Methanolinea sp.]
MHIAKKGLRVLGIAESFSSRSTSLLAGVVMRKDLRIDGVAVTGVTVGGMDATEGVLALVRDLDRKDINCIFLGGCIIAWYNIIDPQEVLHRTGLPVVVVTYRKSEGIHDKIEALFPGDSHRLSSYDSLEKPVPVTLPSGHVIHLRAVGIGIPDATRLCRDFILDGRLPEPVRVARLVARAVMRHGFSGQAGN